MSTLDFLYGSHFGFGHVGGDHKDDSDGSERERPRRQGLVLGDLVPPRRRSVMNFGIMITLDLLLFGATYPTGAIQLSKQFES